MRRSVLFDKIIRMQIKITPLTPKHDQMEGDFKVGSNYYYAKFHYAGILSEVKKSDDWLEQEMSWISRSEIPFITTFRHVQLSDEPRLVLGSPTPIVKRFETFYKIVEKEKFPTNEECKQLIMEMCNVATDDIYHLFKTEITQRELNEYYSHFKYSNDFFVRAGSCLHKAYILLDTSTIFAEDIYVNLFIAFEALIEHLQIKWKTRRKGVISKINNLGLEKGMDFIEHEEEMRDMIRNDIIHPFRREEERRVPNPFLMADFVYEDLAFVDWFFKQILISKIA